MAKFISRNKPGMSYLDLIREYFPNISEKAAGTILWEFTAYPMCDPRTTERQIRVLWRSYLKKHTNCPDESWLAEEWGRIERSIDKALYRSVLVRLSRVEYSNLEREAEIFNKTPAEWCAMMLGGILDEEKAHPKISERLATLRSKKTTIGAIRKKGGKFDSKSALAKPVG